MKIFGGGIIYISDEAIRVFCFHRPIQAFEITLNSPATQPPNNGCCDLISKRIAKKRGMSRARTHFCAYQFFNVRSTFSVNQIARILFCREPDHDTEAMVLSDVEKLPRRHRMWNADGIEPVCGHQRKVSLQGCWVMIFLTVWTRSEGSIGNATNPKFLVADK